LKASTAASDVVTATHSRDVAATSSTTMRKLIATVAAFDPEMKRVKTSASSPSARSPWASLRASADHVIRSS
jgi:hypothetical protein